MPLSDLAVRKAKPAAKAYKLTDGSGLHLYVSPSGGKLWRLRYERGGKEQLLSLGPYPDVSLADARETRDTARQALRRGDDPALIKRSGRVHAAKQETETFEAMAREWHQLQKPGWTPIHTLDVLNSLERDVFPAIGKSPIRKITAPEVLAVVRAVEGRGSVETARRLRQRMSAVFGFAMATARADQDPAAPIKGVLAPLRKGRQPAITSLPLARQILHKVDDTPANPATKLAMRLLALTVVRPGTLIGTPWTEFAALDEREPTWRIPAARMKMRAMMKDDEARDHFVPLSRQAVETISILHMLTGYTDFVLPNGRSAKKPASENALGYLLNRAGYHHRHVPHGWRATFSTIMNERFPADRSVIDVMLAHSPKDKVEGAYNRASHLARRRELAQAWADLITDGLKPPNELLAMPWRENLMPDI